MIIGFALGVGNGMGVVIARLYGARNFEKIKEAVAATWILGIILSVLVMLMGFLVFITLTVSRNTCRNSPSVL